MAITNPDGSIVLETTIDTEGIKKGTADLKSEAAKLAAAYRKAGMSKSEAMTKAWQEVKKLAGETEKATEKTKKYGDETVKSGKKIQSSLKGILTKLTALVGVYQLLSFAKQSVQLASDLEEVQNVVDTAFGEMSYKMEEFADTAIETFGISELTAKQTGSSFMAMAKGMQLADDVASDMALTLTGLSADMASFYNINQAEARTALSAVYTGETETLKRYGILITEVNLQEYARQQGITKSINAMTQQEKVMLRYQYILQATQLAQGDFIRTQDSWANQTRILSERWKEVKVQFGETFKAVGTLVLPVINAVIKGLGYIAQLLQSLASGVYKLSTGQELFAKDTETAKDNINGAVGEQEELTEEIENSKKAQDKFLAGFDDLQRATADMSESFEDAGLDTGFELSVPQLNLGEGSGTNELEKKKDDIIRILGEMGGYIAGALVGIGLILLSSGQIPWGLGFILAGAVTYEVSKVAEKSGYDTKVVTKALKDMTPTIAGALVAIGLILLFLSQIGWGIGFIIAGATVFAVTQQAWEDDDSSVRSVEDKLAIIGEAVSVGLVGIGVMLIFFGNAALGLGFIVGGYHLLKISEQKLSETSIETDIKEWVTANYGAIQLMGSLLIILGVLVMAFSKAHFLKGVSMLIAGAALKYTAKAIDPASEEVSNTIIAFGEEHWDTIAKTGGVLMALGLLLMCTNVGLGLGLAMVIAGAPLIYGAEKLSGGAITEFLNDLGIIIDNWFRGLINSFVRYINKLIPGLELEELPYFEEATSGSGHHQSAGIQAERRKARLKAQAEQAERAEILERAVEMNPELFVPSSTVDLPTANTVQSLNPVHQSGTAMLPVILEVDGTELARSVHNAIKDEALRTGVTLN